MPFNLTTWWPYRHPELGVGAAPPDSSDTHTVYLNFRKMLEHLCTPVCGRWGTCGGGLKLRASKARDAQNLACQFVESFAQAVRARLPTDALCRPLPGCCSCAGAVYPPPLLPNSVGSMEWRREVRSSKGCGGMHKEAFEAAPLTHE